MLPPQIRLTTEAQLYIVLLVGNTIRTGIKKAVYSRSTKPMANSQPTQMRSAGDRVRMWKMALRLHKQYITNQQDCEKRLSEACLHTS